jgi:hypothetical protein
LSDDLIAEVLINSKNIVFLLNLDPIYPEMKKNNNDIDKKIRLNLKIEIIKIKDEIICIRLLITDIVIEAKG